MCVALNPNADKTQRSHSIRLAARDDRHKATAHVLSSSDNLYPFSVGVKRQSDKEKTAQAASPVFSPFQKHLRKTRSQVKSGV